jgi:hypothetical protein
MIKESAISYAANIGVNMKSNFENKITQLIMALVLILVFIFMLITPAAEANSYQPVINGILHQQQENDFFKQGREKFEEEIKLLIQRSRSTPHEILKINPEVLQIHETLSPREKPESATTDINRHNTQRTHLQEFE